MSVTRLSRGIALAIAVSVLAACGTPLVRETVPGNGPGVFARGAQGPEANDLPESKVDKARLEAVLGTLSGKRALPDGRLIKERGGDAGRAITRDFLAMSLEALGYTVERHAYSSRGANILAKLPAEIPTAEHILVGAHMDSVGNAGADDNGSGSAAVLEVATVLRDLPGRKVNLIFAWFDQEELGLVGSYKLAADFRKAGMALTAVHTLDMVGWDSDRDGAIEIERPDANLWDWYVMVNKTHGLGYPLYRTNSGSTDHVAFRSEGFPSVGVCEEWVNGDTTPHYHRRSDAYETINFDYLAGVTRLVAATVADMVRKVAPPPPSARIPHDRFPGRERHFHPHGFDTLLGR